MGTMNTPSSHTDDAHQGRVVHVIVMGVSGSGKTTVAEGLQARTGWEYAEADDFHPRSNIVKMINGEALTDADRRPWLEALRDWIADREREGRSSIVTCSALKRSYRDLLRSGGDVTFVHLDGDAATLSGRLGGRSGHFMPPSLLESQLKTLEPLEPDENGFILSIEDPPARLVDEVLTRLPS